MPETLLILINIFLFLCGGGIYSTRRNLAVFPK